jgi:transmembrane sensor
MDANKRIERISEEAAEWFLRLQDDDLSRTEREQFVEWLRETPAHVAEMLRMAQVHGSLSQFQGWERLPTSGSVEESTVVEMPARRTERAAQAPAVERRPPAKAVRWTALAASIGIIVIAVAFLLPSVRGQVITTERGERREVVLDDGSIVRIDPQTHLRVKFDQKTRRIFLTNGRALFQVAKSPTRPFLVQTDATVVRAVGTAFGVQHESSGVVVTVAEGTVAVLNKSSNAFNRREQGLRSGDAPYIDSGATSSSRSSGYDSQLQNDDAQGNALSEVLLTAGEQVTVQHSGDAIPVRKVDAARELAWAEGQLIFENQNVQHVIAEFNRYNRVQLHVPDPALANRQISGVFSASDPESFVAFVQTVASVHVVRRADQDITITTVQR